MPDRSAPRRLLAAACASALPALAQTTAAPQVVEIVAPAPIATIGLPKDQVPANVQTGRAADLDRSQALDLSSYMNRRFGSVHVNEIQNNPYQADLSFRGFTASPLLGTPQGLSVYVDGVRVNQPFGDVVSWDLIPRAAIASFALMPGSNPLFGLNTLGGAIAIQTKSGLTHPGTSVQLSAGSHERAAAEFETGGSDAATGLHWYAHANRYDDRGWRVDSPSDVAQVFAKIGWKGVDDDVALAFSAADNRLIGNGPQELRLLERDRASVYTKPDITENRGQMLSLQGTHRFDDALSVSANAYWRRIDTSTLNGDVNEESLDQALYLPGETPANTPFPKARCIANAAANDEPAEKCNGVINTTASRQRNHGLTGQLNWLGDVGGRSNLFVAGVAVDVSEVEFRQDSELGYIAPDRSIVGVGAFGDGVSGGTIDGEPYDTRVALAARTKTWSVFATDTLAVGAKTHVTLSGRYNRTTVTTTDAIVAGGGPGSLAGEHRYSRFNPALGITFAPTATLNAYAGYNEGSRTPSAIELGCADPANPCKLPNAMVSDPPLRQVVTRTLEAGLRGGSAGSLQWNVGVYRADNTDDILFVADNAAGFGYFKNFGKTRRQGLEAGLNGRVGRATLGANLTLLDATYRSAEVVDGSSNSSNDSAQAGFPGVGGPIAIRPGDRIPLMPRRLLKLYADVEAGAAWSFGLDMTAVAGSTARGNENRLHQPDGTYYLGPGRSAGYAVFNASAEWRPAKGVKLYANVSNLFDRRYETASQLGAAAFDAAGNFQARPFPANANGDRPLQHSTFLAPGAPRTVVVGVRFAFGP